MDNETTDPQISLPTTGRPARRKLSCLPVAIILSVLLIAGVAGAYLWSNRPIKPVELSQQESRVLEDKISRVEEGPGEPIYEKGSKEIIFTERELNGLLNQNTDLGEKLKLTFATDEIHARVETDLDKDLPVVGGKRLKARARFLVKTLEGRPSVILDDLTIWGASLPNDWLAGMKGKDLLAEIFGNGGGLTGVEEIRIESGRIVIRLAE